MAQYGRRTEIAEIENRAKIFTKYIRGKKDL